MNKLGLVLWLLVVVLCFTGTSNAALWDRGGGLIYDDVLNITWLQDANYAHTLGYDSNSEMNWYHAMEWVQKLEYGGYDDWRLPRTLPGMSYDYKWCYDGSTDRGHNVSAPGSAYPGSTASELAYMYFVNLGDLAYRAVNGTYPQAGWGLTNTGTFINVQDFWYWSGTQCALDNVNAWLFGFNDGFQNIDGMSGSYYSVWAVRDGDVAPVPEPSTTLLIGSGIIGILTAKRRMRRG